MSLDSSRAAHHLLLAGHFRSAISRAYYAAYCAVTLELVARRLEFPRGWRNPPHELIPELVLHNTDWPRSQRYQINKALRRLRTAREDADYRPAASLSVPDARALLRDSDFILRALGIKDG